MNFREYEQKKGQIFTFHNPKRLVIYLTKERSGCKLKVEVEYSLAAFHEQNTTMKKGRQI